MIRLRLPALAQALVVAAILLPGPLAGTPVLAQGDGVPDAGAGERRVRRAAPAGRGLGCTSGVGRFRGPRLPGDPPPPPGSATEPVPSGAPLASPTPSDGSSQGLDEPESQLGRSDTALLGSTGVLVAQADAPPSPEPDASPEPGATAAPTPAVESPAEPRPRKRDRRVRGIDVSHHNGDIDYAAVLASGRSFAFVKATQDTSFRDPMFGTNVQRARQAGVLTGAYHFFDYTLDGAEQADHFLDHIEQAGGPVGWLPPVVDIECWAPSGVSTHVTSAERLHDFIDRMYERTGVLPIIYTSVFMWEQVMGGSAAFGDLPLWAACWRCAAPPSLASGWDDWHFWQTGTARIPRVGRLDHNQFNGTPADLKALVLRPFRIAGGAEMTGSTSVALNLGGRTGDAIRTSSDGTTWSDWRPLRDTATASAELVAVEGPQSLYVQLRARGAESPILRDDITLDLTGPLLTAIETSIAPGPIEADGSLVPIELRWQATDELSGVAGGAAEVDCGDAQAPTVTVADPVTDGGLSVTGPSAALAAGNACRVTISANDVVGNASSETVADVMSALLAEDPSERVTLTGEWRTADVAGATGGAVHVADTPDSSMVAIVAGDEAGIVAVRGPAGGYASVSLDGAAVATIDLYAPVAGGPEVVATIPLTPGAAHVLRVSPDGHGDQASTGTEVAIDGVVLLTTREGGLEVPEPDPSATG